MATSSPISVELPEELAERLEQLARSTNRPVSDWIIQAVEDLIALRDWQREAIQEGIDDAERGDVVSHDRVLQELSGWEARAS